MAGAIQWTVDQFWRQVQTLQSQIATADQALRDDAKRLGALYRERGAQYDPSRDVYIAPLIHRNNVIRINYLGPVKAKFNQAMNAARGILSAAGYTVPGSLGALGDPFVVPAIAVAAIVVAISAIIVVNRLTAAQLQRTAMLTKIYTDPSMTPADKQKAADTLRAQTDAEARAMPPPLFDFGSLVPVAAIAAAIVLGPQILSMMKAPRPRKNPRRHRRLRRRAFA